MAKKILSLLTVLFIVASPIFGQTEEQKIEKMVRDLLKDVEQLQSKGSEMAERVASYTAPNFSYHVRTVNIMNHVIDDKINKEVLTALLQAMRSSNVMAKRKLTDISVNVRENMGLAVYEVDYELYESDRLINKGHQWAYMLLRKNSDGQWKVESLDVLNADDKTFKSTCICEIYENKGLQNILVETILPDGYEADIVNDKISIDESMDPRNVRLGFKDYYWHADGRIFKRMFDGSEGEQIGTAKSRPELILTLIQKEAYPDRCFSVIRKIK